MKRVGGKYGAYTSTLGPCGHTFGSWPLRTPEAIQFREYIDPLLDEGKRCLILDLEHVESIGSGGLYVLIQAHKHAEPDKMTVQGRSGIRIINVRPRIRQILDLTGLTSRFNICGDLAEAVHSLSDCGDRKRIASTMTSSGMQRLNWRATAQP